jgi:hypothetical protein
MSMIKGMIIIACFIKILASNGSIFLLYLIEGYEIPGARFYYYFLFIQRLDDR